MAPPLCYINILHETVTDEIAAHQYKDTDKEYIHTFKLEGVEFTADNKRHFETLKYLLLAGPAWTFIRKFDKDNDGHGAIIALCAQAEGANTKKIQIRTAYQEILAARYRVLNKCSLLIINNNIRNDSSNNNR